MEVKTNAHGQPICSSGIAGLDDILGGGFPQKRIYLVQGDPGVGKTTLGLQFLLDGVARGEACLYISLSETREEIGAVAASHGWSLEGVDVFELDASASKLLGTHNTVFHPSEVELREIIETLLAEVHRAQPTRVVFDSLSEIRLLAQSTLQFRRQILLLKQYFQGKDATVMVLDDRTSPTGEQEIQSLAHGVVTLEQLPQGYGSERRRMRVVKLRGVKFRGGYHDYRILTGGVMVFPRLVAAEHRTRPVPATLKSGIENLDTQLGGGLDAGTSTLVVGPAGSGKSSLVVHYLAVAARLGWRSVLFSFEEGMGTLFARSEAMGIPLEQLCERGLVSVRKVDPSELAPDELVHEIRREVEENHARLVVIDSLNGYQHAMPEERFLLLQMHELLSYLAQKGVVSLLVMTQHGLLGNSMVTPIDVSYVADAVLLLRYFEAAGHVKKAVSVIKKRGGLHEDSIREFRLGPDGLVVGNALADFKGILTGVPDFRGGAEQLMALSDGSDER